MKLRPIISDDNSHAHSIDFSPDAQTIATGCGDGSVRIYSSAAGRRLFRLQQHKSPITAISFKPTANPTDPLQILSASSDGEVTRWHASRGLILNQFKLSTELYNLKFNADGSNFAVCGRDKKIYIFDEQTNSQVMSLEGGNQVYQTAGHSNRVFGLQFDKSNHNLIYSSGWDNTVQIWDLRVGYSVSSIHNVQCCGDSLDVTNNYLLAGSWRPDDSLQIFDLRKFQSEMKTVKEVNYDFSVDYASQNCQIESVEEIKNVQFNPKKEMETGREKVVEKFDFEKMAQQQLKAVDGLEEGQVLPNQSVQGDINQQMTTQVESEVTGPTLIYSCKFNKKNENLIFAVGSGGNEVKIFDWSKDELISSVQAPDNCFCAASSECGRFGAFAGNGFGVQIFHFE